MKKILLELLASVIVLSSCSKHESLFDSGKVKEEAKENFPVKDIDPNHDWNMMAVRTLKVTVDEPCTIRIYTDNPFNEGGNAKLLAETVAENSGAVTLKFDAASAMKLLYVAKIDKNQFSLVQTSLLEGDKFSDVVFRNVGSPRSIGVVLRSIDDNVSDDIFNCPDGLKEITKAEDLYMSASGVIKEGKTVKLDDENKYIFIPDNAILYVKGTLEVKRCWNSFFPGSGRIVVCKEGKIICKESVKLQLSNGHLYNKGEISLNKKGATLDGSSFLYNDGTITCKEDADIEISNATFINEGILQGYNDDDLSLKLSSGAKFSNREGGKVQLEDTEISAGVEWVNEGQYIADEFEIFSNNNSIINSCVLKVDDFKFEAGGAEFLNEGYVECKKADFDNGTLVLATGSIFNVTEKAEFKSNFTVEGRQGTLPALLYMSKAQADDDLEHYEGSNNLYTGNLYVSCPKHFVEESEKNIYIIPTCASGAALVSDKAIITKPEDGECGGSYEIPNIVLPTESEVFTYAFEDIMITAGDYDFNDVVLKVDAVAREGKRIVRLVAAGATNDLYVKYENIKTKDSKSLFDGKEVHEAMRCEKGTLINTTGFTVDPIKDDIPGGDYDLAKDCDFYIVGPEGLQVHIPKHTDDWKDGDVPYAIVVPTDWEYPGERQRIDDKYKDFDSWAQNMKANSTWYKSK